MSKSISMKRNKLMIMVLVMVFTFLNNCES